MTLQAEQIHIADLQHVRVWAAVDHVAGRAAIHLHGRMLVYKRALFVDMAFEADRILSGSHPHLLGTLGAVWIMAVRALDQALVDAVVEGHFKFGPLR